MTALDISILSFGTGQPGDWFDGQGLLISASGIASASGGAASSSIGMIATVEAGPSQVVGDVTIVAEAEAEGEGASASAETDAKAVGEGFNVVEEHDETDVGGDHPVAASFTHLRASFMGFHAPHWEESDQGDAVAKALALFDEWLS